MEGVELLADVKGTVTMPEENFYSCVGGYDEIDFAVAIKVGCGGWRLIISESPLRNRRRYDAERTVAE